MPAQPYVTVIIAASAPGRLVEDSVRSVRKQSSSEWEIVIVPTQDAGNYASLTQELSSGEAAKLGPSQLAVVRNPVPDIASAWNVGVQCSRAETILPIKAGDTLDSRAVGYIRDALKDHPAPFVYFDHRVKGSTEPKANKGMFHLPRLLRENYIDRALAVRRSTWTDADEWDFLAFGDSSWNFLLKLARQGYWGCYVPEVLVDLMPGSLEKAEHLVYNAPDPRIAVESLHPYFFAPEARVAVKRVWEPSICVVVQGGSDPPLDNQTVRDYQVLRNVNEQEAMEQSRAGSFLWLTGARPLRPHALEECIWGLRSAEWVTWTDTGEAPPPSVRKCAGPLGVSRWALQAEEAKRTGEVRRLPWRCREESRDSAGAPAWFNAGTENQTATTNGFEIPSPPPLEHLVAEFKPTLSGKLARRFGGISDWTKHPVDSAAKLIPSRFREGLGNVTVARTYDVDGTEAAKPDADGSKRVSEAVEYMPPPATAGRRRVAIWTPHFGAGGIEQALFELAGQFEPDSVESFLCATKSHDSAWLPLWRDRVTHLYDIRRLLPPEGLTAYAVSFARNWRPGAVLIHGLSELHALLGPLRSELPKGARLAVIHRGSEAERELFSGPLDWLPTIDHHVVSSEAAAKWLYEMTVPEESISVIPPSVDCERFDPKSVDAERWRERLGVDQKQRIVLFAGRLVEGNNPFRVLDITQRLREMRSEKGFHIVIAGDGPLQESLRSKVIARDLAADITLTGTVPDIDGLLAASAILILPGTQRDLPQIVLEALAMKLPVVARRGDSVAGILGGNCLALVGEDEEEDVAFARVVDELLGNPNRREELGGTGRELVESNYPVERSREAWKRWLASIAR